MQLDLKKNRLSNWLGIKPEDDIPMDLLHAIVNATIPEGKDSVTVKNPSSVGKAEYKLTKDNIGDVHKMCSLAATMKQKWKKGGE